MTEQTHTSDTGPFVIVPIWILNLPISHLALRLYMVHADLADRDTQSHYWGRPVLADRLGVTTRSVDDAHKALVAHGALEIRRRRDAKGDPTSNLYIIRRCLPGVAKQSSLPSRPDFATGGEADFSRSSSKASRNLIHSAGPREVDVRPPLPREELKRRVQLLRRHELDDQAETR